jgi:NTE family protein
VDYNASAMPDTPSSQHAARTLARFGSVILAAIAICNARNVSAQAPRPSPDRAARIGVVLSGGGARGIAHIGVLRVLEAEGIVPDVIAGTSMGALVGGLYAVGHSPATLDSIVTSLDWASYFLDDPEHRFLSLDRRFIGDRTILELPLKDWKVGLPSGVVSGQRISELLSRLTWSVQTVRDFRRLPVPFAATGTDIETGEPVVLDSGSVALAMRASMSIPGLFDPVRMHGRLLVDGGITRNLPAREARALGADFLICSDVTDPLLPADSLESLIDVLLQTSTIYTNAASEDDRRLCDVLIRPRAGGLTPADFDDAAAWIARGDSAATAARGQLRGIAGTAPRPARTGAETKPLATRPVQIAAVEIRGVTGDAREYARRRMRLGRRGSLTPEQLSAAVQRVYATELFEQVSYRLDARGSDTVAIVTVEPRRQDHVGIGVRYDDTYDASLLFVVRLRNRLGFGSSSQLDVRLGEQKRVAVEHLNVGISGSRLAAGVGAAYLQTPLFLYADGQRVGDARVDVASATTFGALLRGDAAAVGIELKGERAWQTITVTGVRAREQREYASGAAVVRSNTLDRASYPTRGHMLSLRSAYFVGGEPFAQHVGHAMLALPVARDVTVLARATVGGSSPERSVPLYHLFMLGGAYPTVMFPETHIAFAGLRPEERSGAAVTQLGAAIQWEAQRRIFATLRADVGRAGPRLSADPDLYTFGLGAAVGALTPVGPVEMSGSIRPRGGRALLEISLGYPF